MKRSTINIRLMKIDHIDGVVGIDKKVLKASRLYNPEIKFHVLCNSSISPG